MVILGSIALVLIVVGYIIALVGSSKDEGSTMITGAASIVAGLILMFICSQLMRTREFEASKFNHKIEIRSEVINGIETKTDTVYIFKRK
jgi:Zn-dependent protease with chaperone function